MARFFSMICLLAFSVHASAEPPRFAWAVGDVHAFQVEQTTLVEETAGDRGTSATTTKLTLKKTWSVTAVEQGGAATLVLKIEAYRQELTRPVPGRDGKLDDETIIIDSATPEGAQAVADYLNKPILTAKVDARGRVLEVTNAVGDAGRLKAELPFRIELPESDLKVGDSWERGFAIVLEPPHGTGERHDAVQTCTLKSLEAGKAKYALETTLKSPPRPLADLQPLLPWLWKGTVTIDTATGRFDGADLGIEHVAENHAGPGTRFLFKCSLRERRVEP